MSPEYTPAEENEKILSFRGIPCCLMDHPIGYCLFVLFVCCIFFCKEISSLPHFKNLILFRDIFHYHCCYLLKKEKKKIDTVGSIWTR